MSNASNNINLSLSKNKTMVVKARATYVLFLCLSSLSDQWETRGEVHFIGDFQT